MRNTGSGIVLSLLFLLALAGCEKDQSILLSDGLWHFQDMTTDSEESAVISIVSLTEALFTDATLEFQEGGTYMINSPFLQEPISGEWQLIGEKQLILEPDGEAASTSNINTLSSDKLSYSEGKVDAQMNSYNVTTSWTRN
jgi:hypothetical protein